MLGRWRSILWRFSAIVRFGATGPDLPAFFIEPKNCIFLRRNFWANKKSVNFGPQKVTKFLWNPPIPLLHPNNHAQGGDLGERKKEIKKSFR